MAKSYKCRTGLPSREKINHYRKTYQRLGNLSVVRVSLVRPPHLHSRRTVMARWLWHENTPQPSMTDRLPVRGSFFGHRNVFRGRANLSYTWMNR